MFKIKSRMLGFTVCMGLLSLIPIVSLNQALLLKLLKKILFDVIKIQRKMLGFTVSRGLLPLISLSEALLVAGW